MFREGDNLEPDVVPEDLMGRASAAIRTIVLLLSSAFFAAFTYMSGHFALRAFMRGDVLRMPMAFAMGVAGTVGLTVKLGPRPALSVLERVFFDTTSSFVLVAIRLFILVAELLTAGDVGYAVRTSGHVIPMVLLILAVIGAIYGGLASPSEAAALGVFGALLIGSDSGHSDPARLGTSLSALIKATVMIVAIIACSANSANSLALTRVTQGILAGIEGSDLPQSAILLMKVGVLLVMGMLMDQLAVLFCWRCRWRSRRPWRSAATRSHSRLIVTMTLEIGLLTPPALNAYVAAAHTGVRLNLIFRVLMPFILVIFGILIAFPWITFWLPQMMR